MPKASITNAKSQKQNGVHGSERRLRLLLGVPLVDKAGLQAANFVQLVLVVHHLRAGYAGDNVLLLQSRSPARDRPPRTVRSKCSGSCRYRKACGNFSTLRKVSPSAISPGLMVMARGGQMNSQSWQATQRSRPCSSRTKRGRAAIVGRHDGCPTFSSGYCMETFVLPVSIRTRCRQVIAMPAKIAGM